MPSECSRKGRWIGGCRFEARYDEKPNDKEISDLALAVAKDVRALMILRVYVREVCVNCGATIEREAINVR